MKLKYLKSTASWMFSYSISLFDNWCLREGRRNSRGGFLDHFVFWNGISLNGLNCKNLMFLMFADHLFISWYLWKNCCGFEQDECGARAQCPLSGDVLLFKFCAVLKIYPLSFSWNLAVKSNYIELHSLYLIWCVFNGAYYSLIVSLFT